MLFRSAPFQQVTFAVLPLAAIAGALRNMRVHTADQVIILFEQTNYNVLVNVVEVIATVGGCILGLVWYGLPGAAAGCLAGTIVGVVFCYSVAIVRFGLPLPWDHIARLTAATCVMALALANAPIEQAGFGRAAQIVAQVGLGGLVYAAALVMLYPAVLRLGARKAAGAASAPL